jgi:DNA ligase (NAD+)
VLTGTLPTMSRDQAGALIEAAGGKVVRLGVEKDPLRGRRRRSRQQAGKGAGLGVTMLDEAGLLALLQK